MTRSTRLLLALCCLSLLTSTISFGQDFNQKGVNTILKPYQWQNRLVLIFSDSKKHSHYKEQLELLEAYPSELEDRQLKIVSIFKDSASSFGFQKTDSNKVVKKDLEPLDSATATELRKHYNISDVSETFTVMLIGKDGRIKRQSTEVLEAWELFEQIDSMPMRQREMSN